jgi:deoxycytidine triphosphate deaminase
VSLQKSNQTGMLIFLVGVRGAGKTTTLNSFSQNPNILILKPSTTRPKRSDTEDEYDFVSDWTSEDYAWEIKVGPHIYGMRKSELEKAHRFSFLMTVFDPGSIDILKNFRQKSEYQILTVGLDTIDSVSSQATRVGNDSTRIMAEKAFLAEREIVRNCDVAIRGDAEQVKTAIEATFGCLTSKGGIIQQAMINSFLEGDVLLQNATSDTSPASYDLRLGDDVWCQGKFSTLDTKNPVLKIPPYSYAIVSASELANLPCFIAARFDLKNSLFFQGVILSNGPQIDPGYRGALFCMLYNGSDQPVGIGRGTHFATIEFITTAGVGIGYRDKYQGKTALRDFMPDYAAVSEGGQILERTEKRIDKIAEEWKNFRSLFFALLSIAIAVIVSPGLLVFYNVWSKLDSSREEYIARIQELSVIEARLREFDEQVKKNSIVSPQIQNDPLPNPEQSAKDK